MSLSFKTNADETTRDGFRFSYVTTLCPKDTFSNPKRQLFIVTPQFNSEK